MNASPVRIVVVAGPSGCGKSTIGAAAARIAQAAFFEADDHHTMDARDRMARGRGLTDADRRPWIRRLAAAVRTRSAARSVIACSALNPRVRRWLTDALDQPVAYAFIDVPQDELAIRLAARRGHFAGGDLLPSQLAALDPAGMVRLDGTAPPDRLARAAAALFGPRT